MAYVNDIRTAAPAARSGNFFKAVAERVARYRVYRDTVAELSELNDRDLADLGLSRATIKAVAYQAAYGN